MATPGGRHLIDRLIRGRAWIPLLGVLLAGIVAMRVEILKLNVSKGNSVALASQLQGENQIMRVSVARLSGDQRIESVAQKMGMAMPGPLDIHFVQAGRNLPAAASGIAAPDPETFETDLQAQVAANADSINAVAPATLTPVTSTTPAG